MAIRRRAEKAQTSPSVPPGDSDVAKTSGQASKKQATTSAVQQESNAVSVRRDRYADGSPRPFFRGWLHGIIAVLLLNGSIQMVLMILQQRLGLKWFKVLAMLIGKLLSYGGSAVFHLRPAASVAKHNVMLVFDLTAITVAIWAPSSPFCSGLIEWTTGFFVMSMVTAANLYFSSLQVIELRSPTPRVALLLIYFLSTIAFIGSRYGFRDFWVSGVVFYCLGFGVSPPVAKFIGRAPWHNEKRNTWHEDFHVLLALADVSFLLMSLQFMLGDHAIPLSQ